MTEREKEGGGERGKRERERGKKKEGEKEWNRQERFSSSKDNCIILWRKQM